MPPGSRGRQVGFRAGRCASEGRASFERIPPQETPVIHVERNRLHSSHVDLPVVTR